MFYIEPSQSNPQPQAPDTYNLSNKKTEPWLPAAAMSSQKFFLFSNLHLAFIPLPWLRFAATQWCILSHAKTARWKIYLQLSSPEWSQDSPCSVWAGRGRGWWSIAPGSAQLCNPTWPEKKYLYLCLILTMHIGLKLAPRKKLGGPMCNECHVIPGLNVRDLLAVTDGLDVVGGVGGVGAE